MPTAKTKKATAPKAPEGATHVGNGIYIMPDRPAEDETPKAASNVMSLDEFKLSMESPVSTVVEEDEDEEEEEDSEDEEDSEEAQA